MSESKASTSIDHHLLTSELLSDYKKDGESLTCDYEDLEPVATEEEAATCRQEKAHEEEQEELVSRPFRIK